jgi:cytosine/adenosine deaminase-related metal-dependent hydrolase
LSKRGFWDTSFQPTGIDNTGSVQYLHQLGILNDKTLCVHCVHVSEKEFALLQNTGCHICLCPGSNRYLNVGKAPVAKFLRLGIMPALGTDSLASNPVISLWREMFLLAEDHPAVSPSDILAMATLGGSRALGLANSLGSLEMGKKAEMLAVDLNRSHKSAETIMEELVSHQNRPTMQRITQYGSISVT